MTVKCTGVFTGTSTLAGGGVTLDPCTVIARLAPDAEPEPDPVPGVAALGVAATVELPVVAGPLEEDELDAVPPQPTRASTVAAPAARAATAYPRSGDGRWVGPVTWSSGG
ncbi:MAG: hypothetical protein ACXV0U_04530 [Kineosporiaceae bacterium]